MEEQEISLTELFDLIKKRWKIIAITTLTFVVISMIITLFFIKPVYETKTKIFIGKENVNEAYSNSDISMYQQLITTFSETIKTRDLAKRVIDNTGIDVNPEKIMNNLIVVPINNTQLLQISYRYGNKEDAVTILKGVSDEFIKLAGELVPNSNCRIIEEAQIPNKAISPNKTKNLVLSVILGLIVGLGISLILGYLDNTYKNKNSMEQELKIPTIGTIPLEK